MSTRSYHALSSGRVASGSATSIIHTVSDGEYELDFATIMPQTGVAKCAVWVTALFVFDPSSLTVVQELGSGYATTSIPYTIGGPIPFRGPGYLWFRAISQAATDTLEAQFSFRRLIT